MVGEIARGTRHSREWEAEMSMRDRRGRWGVVVLVVLVVEEEVEVEEVTKQTRRTGCWLLVVDWGGATLQPHL